jgi:pyrroline-5-carboxylate reductase
MNTSKTIAIIGSGNMGASLITGLLAEGYPASHLWITDPDANKLKHLAHQFGIQTTSDNVAAIKHSEIVIFAVKPQILPQVATDLAAAITSRNALVISIAAGVRADSLSHWLGAKTAIVRTMPNTPALVGCGASALFANKQVTDEQRQSAEAILRAVGLVVWLDDEKLLDAVTALSGSGPAYFFLFMEIMQELGEQMGLTSEVARLLTAQTCLGAARMALQSSHSLSELRQQVTSPNGTTEAALKIFERENVRTVFDKALKAAHARSEELAQQFAATETKHA